MEYYAHQGQSVESHLVSVGKLCRDLTGKINVPDIGELLGLLHDFGKYSEQFQVYIKSATGILNPDLDDDYVDIKGLKGTIDHSTAGAQWLWQLSCNYGEPGKLVGQILALCLASHHGGLIDCLDADGHNIFFRRMAKEDEKVHLDECLKNADDDIIKRLHDLTRPEKLQTLLPLISEILNKSDPPPFVGWFKVGLLVRFLYSCLIDADRIDSADHENPQNKAVRRNTPVDWQTAAKRLEEQLDALPVRHEIDHLRRDISNQCKQRSSDDHGIFSLTVPTGGGKTFSAIRFALHHAQKHNLDRVICIIPYTSIIEQNAEQVRKLIEREGDESPWVLEHHSNLEPEVQTWQSKLACENWDAPIVFTTMVQFLETLFAGGTRGPRRMHQLARSVLIFDEVQTLPINCVHLFCNAINFLSDHAGSTVLLCTATQPLLNKLKNPEKGQLTILAENELVADVGKLFADLRRVQIRNRIKTQGWSEMEIADLAINEYRTKGSCLVIVNTKDWARRLYVVSSKELAADSVFHLSTGMCPAQRKEKLAEIKNRLDRGLPVLCISTQLIEAGVDVDFSSVIRFLAGLDSIAQAAGRCNRNGRQLLAEVFVVNPAEEKIGQLIDICEGREITRRIFNETEEDDLLAPETMSLYFSYYFYKRTGDMDYKVSSKEAGRDDSLLNLLSDNHNNIGYVRNKSLLQQSFKTAGNIFKAIDAPTQAVIVPFKRGKSIISDLCAEQNPVRIRQLLKDAQQYSVNVFPNVWRKLLQEQAVHSVNDGSFFCLDERYYSEEFGLATELVADFEPQVI